METNIKSIIWIVVLVLAATVPSSGEDAAVNSNGLRLGSKIETFTFPSNGTTVRGKIFLPASHKENKNLPGIFLVDFEEQHFKIATDEFEKVIEGVQRIPGFDALVVTLESIPDFDAKPESFHKHYETFTDMAAYVDGRYTVNPSRTFIGKGSESGIVLMALFHKSTSLPVFDNFIATDPSGPYAKAIINILETGGFPEGKSLKKLHFSFSTSNDQARCTKIINLINQAQYPWLQFGSVIYTESDYENTYPVSFPEGIQFVFDK